MAGKLGLPRGLIFSPEHSSLLVISSNSSVQSNDRPKCDEDARKIVSTINNGGMISDSHTALVTTTSSSCTKKGLEGAIEDQISKVSQKMVCSSLSSVEVPVNSEKPHL